MPKIPDLSWLLPPIGPERKKPLPPIRLRHLADEDAGPVGALLEDWRESKSDRIPGRSWFRHFGGSSFLAVPEGSTRPVGALLGFPSADQPGEAEIVYLAVDPAARRKGVGHALVTAFEAEQRAAGVARITAPVRPDERAVIGFFASLGYAPVEEPGMRRIYGIPAFADWEGRGEDRAILEHRLG